MRTLALGMAVVIAAAACTTTERTAVEPGLMWSLTEKAPTYAFVPGTEIDLGPSWAAWCTEWGPGDSSTTTTCDEQEFVARVTCSGAPCEIDPPAAGSPSGLAMDGIGSIAVRATTPGDLTIDVVLDHGDTHEQYTRRGVIAIRELERVVIDCIYQPFDPLMPRCEHQTNSTFCHYREWQPCTSQIIADPTWGTPVSMWIYGEGGGYPISPTMTLPVKSQPLMPSVAINGLQLPSTEYVEGGHSDPRAARLGRMYGDDIEQPGMMDVAVVLRHVSANLAVQFVAP